MSNNKQSSVELFAIALYEGGYLQGNGDDINDLLEQHKAMHKKEIEDSFNEGRYPSSVWTSTNAETYYNETFGGNNEQQ